MRSITRKEFLKTTAISSLGLLPLQITNTFVTGNKDKVTVDQ